ncbi:MAG: TetR/AcrR family transcriptional regulator [Magnetococcales bacterium]|nr:TetR/AcrR family transcriptional regulator [Magnetococcales bacterium]
MRPKEPKSPEDILRKAIPLFAKSGYSGVSMRQIARELGISAAALYHHFPDKQNLYLSAVDLVFREKSERMSEAFHAGGSLEERLYGVLLQFIRQVGSDHTFHAVMQRELLEAEPERLRIMADRIFKQFFGEMLALARELSDDLDPNLVAGSIASLVLQHFQARALRPFLEGYQPWHEEPEKLARHFTQIILNGTTGQPT